MRGFGIDIRGINRKVGSSDNDVGVCSELINLKQDNGVKVVPQKKVVSANIPYTNIKIHKIGQTINYIGVKNDATGVFVEHFNPATGERIEEIGRFAAGSEVYYTLLNKQLVISDKTAIKLYVYQFKNGLYQSIFDGFDVNIDYEVKATKAGGEMFQQHKLPCYNEQEFLSSCQSVINKFNVENSQYCEGSFTYAFSVTLNDGAEHGMFGLGCVGNNNPFAYKDGYYISFGGPYTDYGTGVKLTEISTGFNFYLDYYSYKIVVKENSLLLQKHKELIKSVNLYVSKPISSFDLSVSKVTFENLVFATDGSGATASWTPKCIIDTITLKESGLEKSLMYRQKTWSLEEFCKGLEYTLEFGGDKQTTGATMEVSQSSIDRSGKMFTYNNKVHFYDSLVRVGNNLLEENFGAKHYDKTQFVWSKADVYVYLRSVSDRENVIKYSNYDIIFSDGIILFPNAVVYPDSRAYKIDVIVNSYKYTLLLSPSPAYNYAFCYTYGNYTKENFDGKTPELNDTYQETNAINVTANGQPMVFPVSYSYKFNGNITALAVATDAISESQIGQYPLSVFTDNGIFALEQGNGDVLYSNIVPISNDVCTNDSVLPIRGGIAYIAHDSLWLLQGRKSTKMSEILEGDIDTYIQDNNSFIRCCGGDLYNITPHLSLTDFKSYTQNATLSWCPTSNEIIVSNANYNYSYVYDFINNSWYKVSGIFEMIGDNMLLRPVSINSNSATNATGVIRLASIHTEKNRTIAALSRSIIPSDINCGAGHTIALVIDNTQMSSATFSQITYAPMMIATLCDKVSYLEDANNTIYSTIDLSGKTIKIVNVTTNTEIALTAFEAISESVNIPTKGFNETLFVNINGNIYSTIFSYSDSVITVLSNLAKQINNSDANVSAQQINNSISLTAKKAGLIGNSITISAYVSNNDYIYFSSIENTLTGGQDISLQPSDYREIINWVQSNPGTVQIVHLHTRPLHLGNNNSFKILRKTVLNCLSTLNAEQNLSMYIFASNNLIQWKCVCAAQRQKCSIAQLITDRTAKAYKYFIFMIGGIVNDYTQISNIVTAIEDVADKKIR